MAALGPRFCSASLWPVGARKPEACPSGLNSRTRPLPQSVGVHLSPHSWRCPGGGSQRRTVYGCDLPRGSLDHKPSRPPEPGDQGASPGWQAQKPGPGRFLHSAVWRAPPPCSGTPSPQVPAPPACPPRWQINPLRTKSGCFSVVCRPFQSGSVPQPLGAPRCQCSWFSKPSVGGAHRSGAGR